MLAAHIMGHSVSLVSTARTRLTNGLNVIAPVQSCCNTKLLPRWHLHIVMSPLEALLWLAARPTVKAPSQYPLPGRAHAQLQAVWGDHSGRAGHTNDTCRRSR